jgi:secreted trypsin-like serine protease
MLFFQQKSAVLFLMIIKAYYTKGDSGGPLVVNNGTNRFVLVGATSFGVASCEGPYPSMFARWVSKMII